MRTTLKALLASSLMVTVAVLFTVDTVQAQDKPSAQEGDTIIEVVNSKEKISEFARLLEASGYAGVLQDEGPFTVLAPNNEAVQNADSELRENPEQLMKGQLFKGNVSADQVESQMGVTVEETDNSASNGVVYVVDQVVTQQ